jgi:hypothetical protein
VHPVAGAGLHRLGERDGLLAAGAGFEPEDEEEAGPEGPASRLERG